ncbi:MAG: glycosyltransferase [Thermodesulfobacteriota bacterium]
MLPTYNERENIGDLIETLLRIMTPLSWKTRIMVVDDNSPDGTADLVRERFSGRSEVDLLVRTTERGLATAIAAGIEQSQAEVIAVMDTDFNHHPNDLPRLLDRLTEADLVIGSRYISGGGMKTSRLRYWGSWVFNVFIRLTLGSPVKDNLSGFLVFRREIITRLKDQAIFYGYGDYCIRLIHYARKAGIKIREVPVVYEFRMGGESKTDFSRYIISYFKATLALRFSR